jgi:hypothetical protein
VSVSLAIPIATISIISALFALRIPLLIMENAYATLDSFLIPKETV